MNHAAPVAAGPTNVIFQMKTSEVVDAHRRHDQQFYSEGGLDQEGLSTARIIDFLDPSKKCRRQEKKPAEVFDIVELAEAVPIFLRHPTVRGLKPLGDGFYALQIITGDACVATVVASSEGQLGRPDLSEEKDRIRLRA